MKRLFVKTIVCLAFVFSFNSTAAAQVDPYIGQIMWVGFTFCPRGWAEANGQTLDISSNTALFSLFGTTYGGDGRTTFGLPDLRGRAALHVGQGPGLSSRSLGTKSGQEEVTLSVSEIPSHNHLLVAKEGRGVKTASTNSRLAESGIYRDNGTDKFLGNSTVTNTGGGGAHNNMPPFLVIRACVALVGTFPPRS